ncbi:MAG: GNAT family N-acetyltransferase [Acidimicrobiales bacterium]
MAEVKDEPAPEPATTAPSVTISAEPVDGPDSLRLIDALDDLLGGLYEIENNSLEVSADDFEVGRGTFLVAREAGVAVGCGGVRLVSRDVAEVKRMFVVPQARGRGIAAQLLAALEEWSVLAGARKVVLETGVRQPSAMRLYERLGYVEIAGVGPYAESGQSRSYEKELGPIGG